MERKSVVVSEIFGPTIQGEGPSSGRLCGFLRLGGCNLTCTWCDTPYTWDWRGLSRTGHAFDPKVELHTMSTDDVVEQLKDMSVRLVVVTGGEPLQQQLALISICRQLRYAGIEVEIETNGTKVPHPDLLATGVRFNVSPKLRHSGVTREKALNWTALKAFGTLANTAFKFVCRNAEDLAEVKEIVDCLGNQPAIWIMPEGVDRETISAGFRSLADDVVSNGWYLTSRLHVYAWGDKRGV